MGGGERWGGRGDQTHSSSPESDRKGSKTTLEKVVLFTALAPALGPSCSQYVAGDKRTEKESHKRKRTRACVTANVCSYDVTLKNLSLQPCTHIFRRWRIEIPPSVNHLSFSHTCTCLNV